MRVREILPWWSTGVLAPFTPAPELIAGNETGSTVDLFWTDVGADNYILEQDGVEIYSGPLLTFQATGLSEGSYDFRVKAQGAGFSDSAYSNTVTVDILTFYNTTSFVETTANAVLAARQTTLEPSTAGVDKVWSFTGWFRVGANHEPDITQYFGRNYTGSAYQFAVYRISSHNQTPANCETVRFGLFNGANFIEVQSTSKIKSRHWYHISVTYDGTELNTGMEIYINGVLETVTRTSGGSYVGALNNASLRIGVGTASGQFVGNVKDVAIWNRELSQADVTELYNGGVPIDVTTVSFYADILALWKFETNANCTNNASFNFTATGLVHSNSSAVDINRELIYFKRAQPGNTRYVAFGDAYFDTNDNKVKMYVRSGTSHVAGGRVQKIEYDPATGTVVVDDPVILDGSYSMSGVSCGLIGTEVHVFSTRYNQPADTFIDSRIYRSTDGLVGEVFDAGEVVVPNYSRYEWYGTMVSGNGFKVVPYFGHNGAGTWKVSVFKSDDDFATHTKIDVYDGPAYYGEAWLAYSNNRWILLMRRNQAPWGIMMSYSDDDCETWSVPALTNLGDTAGACNCAIAVGTTGLLNIVIMQRGREKILISKNNNIDDVIASPTSFESPTVIGRTYNVDSYNPLGYPNIVHLGNEEYFVAASYEQSASRADIFLGHGLLNELT